MIPFHPKFGSAEDAPNYGPAASEDKCENCAHYRNLGPRGYCEKFSFMAAPEHSCDDFRPAGVVKESSSPYTAFGGIGAASLGSASLYKNRHKMLDDHRKYRAGEITDKELSRRRREYASLAALDATIGGALGAGAVYGAKNIALPHIRRAAEDVADFAGTKVKQTAQTVSEHVDDLVTKQREASEAAARSVAKDQIDAFADAIKAEREAFKSDISENVSNLRDSIDPLGIHRRANERAAAPPKPTLRERLFGARPKIEGE